MTRSEEVTAILRGRMTSGRLRPGDRAPSTRAIMREFAVAMATASKVLAVLRDEGLVATEPGRGTIVLDPHTRHQSPRPEVSTTSLVAAAVATADTEGLDAVSMRRLATELGVSTMSLYRHIVDKDDLLLRMMDLACRDLDLPAPPPSGWRAQLEHAAHELWRCFRRHPWLAGAMSMTRPQPIPSAMAYSEWVLVALRSIGHSPQQSLTLHLAMLNMVRGVALTIEPELADQAATGVTNDEWADAQTDKLLPLIHPERFPHMHDLVQQNYDYDFDEIFETGLSVFLDGLAAQLSRR